MRTHCVLIIFILIFGGAPGCSSDKRGTTGQNQQLQDSLLLGKWYLNEWTWYNELQFNRDSTVALQNHVDTVFWYRYRVRDNQLELVMDDNVAGISQILVLTPDSLILNKLLSTGSILRYSRQNHLAPTKGQTSGPAPNR